MTTWSGAGKIVTIKNQTTVQQGQALLTQSLRTVRNPLIKKDENLRKKVLMKNAGSAHSPTLGQEVQDSTNRNKKGPEMTGASYYCFTVSQLIERDQMQAITEGIKSVKVVNSNLKKSESV